MPQDEQSQSSSADLGLISDAPPAETPISAADALQKERSQVELDQLRERVKEFSQNMAERKRYATRIFTVMIGWLLVVAFVVLAQGFGYGFPIYAPFHLSDGVVIALLTTATATVVGVFLIVVKYLFSKQ